MARSMGIASTGCDIEDDRLLSGDVSENIDSGRKVAVIRARAGVVVAMVFVGMLALFTWSHSNGGESREFNDARTVSKYTSHDGGRPGSCSDYFADIFLSVNFNNPLMDVIPIYDQLYGRFFPNRAYKVPWEEHAVEWARRHPAYKVDFINNSNKGWQQQVSFLDSMRRYVSPGIVGYLHTNDDVLLNLRRLSELNKSKVWGMPCDGTQIQYNSNPWDVLQPECSAAAVECKGRNRFWKPSPWNIEPFQLFANMKVDQKDMLASNMKGYPFSNKSACAHTADYGYYIPARLRERYIEAGEWALPFLQRFAFFLPTVPRLLEPVSMFEFVDMKFLWG